MSRLPLAACLAALLAPLACRQGAPERDVVPPAAVIPAPARLTDPGVTDPPAPAPTAKGTYASMTPPFMQHTPPRPRTRGAAAPRDSAGTRDAVPATRP